MSRYFFKFKTLIMIIQIILQVSWIRRRDYRLLTVGLSTYTEDLRFQSLHHVQTGVSAYFEYTYGNYLIFLRLYYPYKMFINY